MQTEKKDQRLQIASFARTQSLFPSSSLPGSWEVGRLPAKEEGGAGSGCLVALCDF